MGIRTQRRLRCGTWIAGLLGPWLPVTLAQEWVEPGSVGFSDETQRAPRREGIPLATWTPRDGPELIVEPTVDRVAAITLYAGQLMTLPAYEDSDSGERREGLMICLESKSAPFVGPAGVHALGTESGIHHWGYNQGLGIDVVVATETVGRLGEEKVLILAFDDHGARTGSNRRLYVFEARTGRQLGTVQEDLSRPWHHWPRFAALPDVTGDGEEDFSILARNERPRRSTGQSLRNGYQIDIYSGRTLALERTIDLGHEPNVHLGEIYWDAWVDAGPSGTPNFVTVALEVTDGDPPVPRTKVYHQSVRSGVDGEVLESHATPSEIERDRLSETFVEDLDGDGLRDLACTSHLFDSVQYRSLATFELLDTWTPPADKERSRNVELQVLGPTEGQHGEFVLLESRGPGRTLQAELWQPRGRGKLGTLRIRGAFDRGDMRLLPDADGDSLPELAVKWGGISFDGQLLFPSRRWFPGE